MIDEILSKYRYQLLVIFAGLILVGVGVLFFKTSSFSGAKVEVLNETKTASTSGEITAEISGAVTTPGVYKLSMGARIEDLLVSSGGFSVDADRNWTDKYLNRAAKVTDGQKVYIPKTGEQTLGASAKSGGGDQSGSSSFSSDSNTLINVNTASLKELDTIPGIGQTYGQNIIDHRPYSNTQELVSKGAIKQSLYEKIKDLITIY